MSDPVVSIAPDTTAATQQFRSQVGHISRQSGVFFAGTVFTVAFGYLFKVYLARVLGPEELGLYALGMTLIGFLGLFNTLGLPQSALRFVAAYQATGKFKELHALLWRGAGLLLATNILLAGVLLVFGRFVAVRFYHSPPLVKYLPWFAVIMLFGMVTNFYSKVLAGYRDLKLRTLIVNFVGSPLNMLTAVLLISAGMGLRGYLLAQILSAAVISFLLVLAVRKFTPAEARFSSRPGAFPGKEVWSFSTSMLGIGFMEFSIGQVDKVALGYYRSAREVGIYAVATAVVVYVPLALSSINQIFAPTISDLHSRGQQALLARLFQSLTKWATGITMPLALVIIILARPIMRIFGPNFESGWPILVIGTLGQLVNCGVGSVGYLLQMSGYERRLLKVEAVMGSVMVVLSIALVPLWGITGAAVAAAVTNVGVNVWNLLAVRQTLGISPYNRGYLGLLPPTVAVALVSLVLKRYAAVFRHDWLVGGVALVLAYGLFSIMIFMRGLDPDDKLIANAIWARIRGAFVRIRTAETV
jgi:O-antigen/teichoic acid export membrane protein